MSVVARVLNEGGEAGLCERPGTVAFVQRTDGVSGQVAPDQTLVLGEILFTTLHADTIVEITANGHARGAFVYNLVARLPDGSQRSVSTQRWLNTENIGDESSEPRFYPIYTGGIAWVSTPGEVTVSFSVSTGCLAGEFTVRDLTLLVRSCEHGQAFVAKRSGGRNRLSTAAAPRRVGAAD